MPGLVALSLLVACSARPVTPNDPGTAGASGTGGSVGAGGVGTSGGNGGGGGRGGVGTSVGGRGGVGFVTGGPGLGGTSAAGTGGTMPLPPCEDGAPSFGVCFVNDADVLPLPPLEQDPGTRANGTAIVEDVGTGPAPAQCENARLFGARGPSDWWFQARASDNNRVWTIGVRGLGNAPLVHKDQRLSLNLSWRGDGQSGLPQPSGDLAVLDEATMTPLLWAGANPITTAAFVMVVRRDAVCRITTPCEGISHNVLVYINGSDAFLPPYGSGYAGGYYIASGAQVTVVRPQSSDGCGPSYRGPSFEIAAAKVP